MRRKHVLLAVWPLLAPSLAVAEEPYRVALGHVLVVHREAFRGKTDSPTREKARELAATLRARAVAPGADFAALAREHSDDTDRRKNAGLLGIFRQGELADDFAELETAAFGLAIGEVSSVVETPLGFHVLRRVEIEEWRARHILVRYEGARGAPRRREDDPEAGRSKDEARRLCEKLTQLARRKPDDFGTLARRYSDSPDRVARGSLGVFTHGESIPQIVEQVSRMAEGEIAGPVESDYGFHVVLREPLDSRRFSIIRIPLPRTGAPDRTAAARIAKLRERIVSEGADFAALAREHSRHPRARLGGDLGILPVKRLPKPLIAAAGKLGVGDLSEVIRAPDGLYLVRRETLTGGTRDDSR